MRLTRFLPYLLPLMVACTPTPPPVDDGACAPLEGPVSNLQQTLRATGLWKTDSTNLAPVGALQRADNAVLRDDGFLEPTRGFAEDVDFGTPVDALYPWTVDGTLWLIARGTDATLYRRVENTGVVLSRAGSTVTATLNSHGLLVGAKVALFQADNQILFLLGTKTVATAPDANHFTYTEAGTAGASVGKVASVAAYAGAYAPPPGYPMRFWEAGQGGNLFFTTSQGVYRLDSPTATPVPAGSPKGLEGRTTVSTPSDGGWFNYGETVGYRANWGKRTEDGRLILGAPSGRMLLTNTAQDATPVLGTFTRSGSTVTMTYAAHGLTTGDTVYITVTSNEQQTLLGAKVVTVVDSDTFAYAEPGTETGSGSVEMLLDDDGVRNAVCTTYIPNGIVEGVDFCQFNRTVLTTTGGGDPGEDMAMVGERFPNATEIAAKTITFEDIAPFANGANAYYSPGEGLGGINAALLQPPLVTDGLAFREFAFAVAAQNRRQIGLSLLAIGGRHGLVVGDSLDLILGDVGGDSEVFQADLSGNEDTGSPGLWKFGIYDAGTTAANLENTARSLVAVINHRSSVWEAAYASAEADPPGRVLIAERNLLPDASIVDAGQNHRAWSPDLHVTMSGTSIRVGSTVTVTAPIFGVYHFEIGDKISVSSNAVNFPAGTKTITSIPTVASFTYVEAGADAGPTAIVFANNAPHAVMETNLAMNSWMFSAPSEWDGFPELNFRSLGGPTNTLSRIYQFGQSVLYFSDEGIWRLNGTDPTNFQVNPYPNGGEHVRLVAPNTVAKLSGGVFALTETGVTGVDEVTFNQNIGMPIWNVLRQFVIGPDALKTATRTYAFGVGNEADGEYWLFLPDETDTTPLYPTQAYVYATKANGGQGGWTRYIGDARTAVYSRADQRMYLAPTTSGPILRERRDKAVTDFLAPDNVHGVDFGVEYVPFRGTAATAEKQWVKAVLSVENSSASPMPETVGMWFSTSNDGHTTWWGNEHTAHGDGIYATYSPLEVCRGAELGVKVEHNTPLEWLRIKDLGLTYNQASELRRGK